MFVAILLCVMVVAMLASIARNSEPRYDGKLLSEWLTIYNEHAKTKDADHQKAERAVRAIGTRAIPFLVRWISQSPLPSENKRWLYQTMQRLPRYLVPKRLLTGAFYLPDKRISLAGTGFKILGPVGAPAIPELSRLAGASVQSMRQYEAIVAKEMTGHDPADEAIEQPTVDFALSEMTLTKVVHFFEERDMPEFLGFPLTNCTASGNWLFSKPSMGTQILERARSLAPRMASLRISLEWLLLARLHGQDADDRVPMVRRGNHHRVNILARKDLAEILRDETILVLVAIVDRLLRAEQMIAVHIARGDDLCVLVPEIRSEIVAAAMIARADEADRGAVVGRGRATHAEEGGGDDLRRDRDRKGSGGGVKKLPSRETEAVIRKALV
jgi:hypothetical protein